MSDLSVLEGTGLSIMKVPFWSYVPTFLLKLAIIKVLTAVCLIISYHSCKNNSFSQIPEKTVLHT